MKKEKRLQKKNQPFVVLLILDGWGVAPPHFGNALGRAKIFNFERLRKSFPFTTLVASGRRVGLGSDEPGNSEAGHLNIGAGRVVAQDGVRICHAVNDGTFFRNGALLSAVHYVREKKSAFHIVTLLSAKENGHAHPDHLFALMAFVKIMKLKKVFFHLITDGRDSSPFDALRLLEKYKRAFARVGKVATVTGRYWAMDRNKEWHRTERAYHAMVLGEGITFEDPIMAVEHAYKSGLSDEFLEPSVITKNHRPVGTIKNNDALIFLNLRSDRARQMAKPFVQNDFEKRGGGFVRKKFFKDLFFVAFTDFGPDLDSIVTAFPSSPLLMTLPLVFGLRYNQCYLAESEKYAHITYFFNGGYANPIAKETRIRVLSPEVKSFSLAPEMSIRALSQRIEHIILQRKYDFIAANIANADMVGHTGDIRAAIIAVEKIDECIGKISKIVARCGGILIITADHGNVEEMIDHETNEMDTKHSRFPVPFMVIGKKFRGKKLRDGGALCDIAPTILKIFGIPQPKEMTGNSLFRKM